MNRSIDFSAVNILIVGDVMLDRYWNGECSRISPEAPVPVVKIQTEIEALGGAGNVAANIAALGGNCSLMSVIGEDLAASSIRKLLSDAGVGDQCIGDAGVKTIVKLRVLAQHQQLIRMDFENELQRDEKPLLDTFTSIVEQFDLIVFSDYAKGCISSAAKYISAAKKLGKKVLIDPKSSDFSSYQGAFLVTPNKKEFEQVVGPVHNQEQLETAARKLIGEYDLGGLLVTQGAEGMTLVMREQPAVSIPTSALDVYDVTGAGDTVIASLASAIAAGWKEQDAAQLSSLAAGIAVGKVGTVAVTREDLMHSFDRDMRTHFEEKLMTQEEVDLFVRRNRGLGKKIIMTNGCFDLLHAGHVQYLSRASRLGDVLVVAVNDDASVARLKGEERPVNRLNDRMLVLSGLSSVDAVVAFSEDTPKSLICRVKPDILVKGGDYQISEIAGRECASEVRLIELMPDKSTTAMLQKIKA